MEREKLIIIGSGPAGYTAALYASRANLKPILFEGFYSGPVGGQLMTTTEVENYPGFPQGIKGPELMGLLRAQAEKFGTRYIMQDVTSCDLSKWPFTLKGGNREWEADSIIIATGAVAKRLDIKGTRDDEFWNRGVTACAVCDGANPIFRNQPLFVIGGGDSAVEEALFLTHYGSKVYIVHRRDSLRASKIMVKRALSHPKIEILWDTVVEEVSGEKVVQSITLKNLKTGHLETRPAAGLFFAVGHEPNTKFLNNQVDLHPNGYIKVVAGTAQTSKEGVFAAGDVQDFVYRQAITAAGSGCMAALEAERWLSSREA